MTSPPTKKTLSRDPFKTGEAWSHFLSLEKELGEFVEYVPLDWRNRNVFSPRLGTILISAATQIEATFKAIINSKYMDDDDLMDKTKLYAARKSIEKKRGNFEIYREIVEPYFLLSRRQVIVRQYLNIYVKDYPYKKFMQGRALPWWESYTNVKHFFYENIRQATLRRTISAVAALFLIQMMHLTHRETLIKLNVIKSGHRDIGFGRDKTQKSLIKLLCSSPREVARNHGISDIWVETKFFEMSFYFLGTPQVFL